MLILLAGNWGYGQIVNIEDKRRQLDSVGWSGQLDLSGQLTQNTRRVIALSAGLRLDSRTAGGNFLLLGNYNLASADEDRFINDGFGHLRYGHRLDEKWSWEAFGQLQYNRRLNIGLRGLLGSGPRLQLANTKGLDLAVGLLYMFEYNELSEGQIIRRDHRLSGYLSLRFVPKDYLMISSTSYYQPLLTAWEDRRFSIISTLQLTVTEQLKITSGFSLVYDGLLSRLTEGVPRTTYQWKNGLRFQF